MNRLAVFTVAATTAAFVLMGAQRPALFGQTAPGLWEISGVPGARVPPRECVADTVALARYEHRSRSCAMKVTSDSPSSAVVDYSCGGAGFGHTKVDLITPRSLRIETQGVSDKLPFSYVIQARRVGDCPGPIPAPRH
ncbi:MAG TPA: DUF3617 family protein [Sphingomicrobium sp.]|nr:DUF3617 family protein [Sphingomicrobium sp.]